MIDNNIQLEVFSEIQKLIENDSIVVASDSPLIGNDSSLDSVKIVELCIALEDKALQLGFEFDWTSDVALSKSRSMFRTAGSLADEFIQQMQSAK